MFSRPPPLSPDKMLIVSFPYLPFSPSPATPASLTAPPPDMPSFATTSVIRDASDGFALALTARHVLVAGAPSSAVHAVKGRFPSGVDVILQSNLSISIDGKYNGASVDARTIQSSALAKHLLNYFCVVRALSWPRP